LFLSIGRTMTSRQLSIVSQLVDDLLENPNYDLGRVPPKVLEIANREIDEFVEVQFWQLGDKQFIETGLRHATDKLFEFLRHNAYYH